MLEESNPNPIDTYWICSRSTIVHKKNAERYQLFDSEQRLILSAHGFCSSRPTELFWGEMSANPDFLLMLRKSFAFSGKIDLLDASNKQLLGIVTRKGEVFDKKEQLLGRFVSGKTWKDQLGEGLTDLAAQVLLGAQSNGESGPGADSYILSLGKEGGGSLRRERLPFFPAPQALGSTNRLAKLLKNALPKKWTEKRPPLGWRFSLTQNLSSESTKLPLLAGAVMTLELRRWA